MLLLTTVFDSVALITSGVQSTDWTASYVDITTSSFTPLSAQGNIAAATTTTIVNKPAANTQRQIKLLSVRNRDLINSQTVTVARINDVNTYRVNADVTLAPGEFLTYVDGVGFQVFDAGGRLKTADNLTLAFSNPNGLIELTANNGVASTALRSDATPALDLKLLYQVNPRMYTQGGAL